jgi:DNA-binding MarR family transcriptional regulator
MSSNSEKQTATAMSKAELAEAIGNEFRINQNRSDVFDEIAGEILGLNQTDQRCLDIISRLGQTTAGELARESGLTTGGVTAVVDRLERDGYVRRVRDERDRRKVLLEATPESFEKVWAIWGPLKDAWDAQARSFTREQLEFLLRFMREGNEIAAKHIERIQALRGQPGKGEARSD